MRHFFHRILSPLAGLFSLWVYSCTPSPNYDPPAQPYAFERLYSREPNLSYQDLDNDGFEEKIARQTNYDSDSAACVSSMILRSHNDQIIGQANVASLGFGTLWFLDMENDGKKEIVSPFMRHDSLFVIGVNQRGEKLFSFFLCRGQSRRRSDGAITTDIAPFQFYFADVDHDTRPELVSLVAAGLTLAPRGVFIHSIPEGRLLSAKFAGAAFRNSHLGDFDGDGVPEILVITSTPNNGAAAGGFDDRHAYLINFKLSLPIEITRSREIADDWTYTEFFYEDLDNDGQREFLWCTGNASTRLEKSNLQIMDAATWRTTRQLSVYELIRQVITVDLNHDGRREIVLLCAPQELRVLNDKFEVLQRQNFALPLSDLVLMPDFNGDGSPEIGVNMGNHSLLLDHRLAVNAALPKITWIGTAVNGLGKPPLVVIERNGQHEVMRMVENKIYLWHRHRPMILWSVGSIIMAAMLWGGYAAWRNLQQQEAIRIFALDTDGRAIMLLDERGKPLLMNALWKKYFPSQAAAPRQNLVLQGNFLSAELIGVLKQTLVLPAHRHETILQLTLQEKSRAMQMIVEPIPLLGARLCWLVTLEDRTEAINWQQAQTWSAMTRHVAHEIKNPLTSILLTLQRLQTEYRQRSPEIAPTYDDYTERMIERIETLRRMTRNFMKFINLEPLHLADTDLNGFLRTISAKISKNLPPDIQLALQLGGEALRVRIDHEEIQTLIENLISNAINAMPDGGKITFATHLAPKMLLHSLANESRDYAVLEVHDTGAGMSKEIRARLFELNFTTSENGTGLGLTLVKKIVDAHSGHIEVESEPGAGTVFSIYWPVI
jgi:signal transduction histidine kinase